MSNSQPFCSATILKESTATSGQTERKRPYPRNDSDKSNGRRNYRPGGGGGGAGGGQAALKLENPMRVQRVAQAPRPPQDRRSNSGPSDNNSSRGPQDRNSRGPSPDRNSRPAASNSGGGADGGSSSKSDIDYSKSDYKNKPKKNFDDGRCENLKSPCWTLYRLSVVDGWGSKDNFLTFFLFQTILLVPLAKMVRGSDPQRKRLKVTRGREMLEISAKRLSSLEQLGKGEPHRFQIAVEV